MHTLASQLRTQSPFCCIHALPSLLAILSIETVFCALETRTVLIVQTSVSIVVKAYAHPYRICAFTQNVMYAGMSRVTI